MIDPCIREPEVLHPTPCGKCHYRARSQRIFKQLALRSRNVDNAMDLKFRIASSGNEDSDGQPGVQDGRNLGANNKFCKFNLLADPSVRFEQLNVIG